MFIMFIIDFRERKQGKDIDMRNIDPLPPAHARARDQTCSLALCPDRESNTQPLGVQGDFPTS